MQINFMRYVMAGRGMSLFSREIDKIRHRKGNNYIRDEFKAMLNVYEEEE